MSPSHERLRRFSEALSLPKVPRDIAELAEMNAERIIGYAKSSAVIKPVLSHYLEGRAVWGQAIY